MQPGLPTGLAGLRRPPRGHRPSSRDSRDRGLGHSQQQLYPHTPPSLLRFAQGTSGGPEWLRVSSGAVCEAAVMLRTPWLQVSVRQGLEDSSLAEEVPRQERRPDGLPRAATCREPQAGLAAHRGQEAIKGIAQGVVVQSEFKKKNGGRLLRRPRGPPSNS